MNTASKIVSEISRINQSISAPDITRPVAELLNGNDKTIFVAVLGQFKSGKSSLINSIIGVDLLPTGVLPVTSVVTRLRYGDRPKLIILNLDRSEIICTLEHLPLYVTEALNPGNYRKVDQVIIEHPVLISLKNLSLVDTPGLGSLYRHNTETTNNWLPFTGMGIISVGAERPLSEDDVNLIKETARHCPTLAVVITKSDLVNEDLLPEIESFIRQAVLTATGRDTPVYPFSINRNSPQYRSQIVNGLLIPLNESPEESRQYILKHKLKNLVGISCNWAELALQAALQREAGKDSVNRLLDELKFNFHHYQREMLLTASSFKGGIRAKLEKIFLPFSGTVIDHLAKQFSEDYSSWDGNLYRVSRDYESWLKMKLADEIASIDEKCSEQLTNLSRETADYFQFVATRFRQMLDEKLYTNLEVHLPESDWQIEFMGFDHPDVAIYRAFDSQLDMLLFFLPMSWFRKLFDHHFRRQIPFETDKNFYRHLSDLTEKINKSIDVIHQQALHYVHQEMMIVENILVSINTDASDLKNNLKRLEELKKELYAR